MTIDNKLVDTSSDNLDKHIYWKNVFGMVLLQWGDEFLHFYILKIHFRDYFIEIFEQSQIDVEMLKR